MCGSLSISLYFTCTFIMCLGLSGGHSWIAIYIVLSAGWAWKSRLVMGDTFAIIFQFRSAFEMQILSSGKKLFQQQNVLTKSDKIFHNLSTNHICCIYICVYRYVCVYRHISTYVHYQIGQLSGGCKRLALFICLIRGPLDLPLSLSLSLSIYFVSFSGGGSRAM